MNAVPTQTKRQEKECGNCVNKKDCVATTLERLTLIYWLHLCRDTKSGLNGICLATECDIFTEIPRRSHPPRISDIMLSVPQIFLTILCLLPWN